MKEEEAAKVRETSTVVDRIITRLNNTLAIKKKTTCAKDLYVLFSVFLVPFTGVLGREGPRRRKWVSVSVSLNYIKGFL